MLATRVIAMLVLTVTWSGCSDNKTSVKGSNGKKGGGSPIEVLEENKGVEGIDSYQGVSGGTFLVKNYMQLKSAAEACLGAGYGTITDDMFAAGRCAANQGKATPPGATAGDSKAAGNERQIILGADKCTARGQNIYDVLKDQLWSPDLAGRTDTLSNQLTPGYLQALAVSADVYAHGLNMPGGLCDDASKAQALVAKCLAQFPSDKLSDAAEVVGQLCSQGGIKAREAVATILGSAAFAAAAPGDQSQTAKAEEAKDDDKIETE